MIWESPAVIVILATMPTLILGLTLAVFDHIIT